MQLNAYRIQTNLVHSKVHDKVKNPPIYSSNSNKVFMTVQVTLEQLFPPKSKLKP